MLIPWRCQSRTYVGKNTVEPDKCMVCKYIWCVMIPWFMFNVFESCHEANPGPHVMQVGCAMFVPGWVRTALERAEQKEGTKNIHFQETKDNPHTTTTSQPRIWTWMNRSSNPGTCIAGTLKTYLCPTNRIAFHVLYNFGQNKQATLASMPLGRRILGKRFQLCNAVF